MIHKSVNIVSSAEAKQSILIIYTGGTFGMVKNSNGTLAPFNFGKVVKYLPELNELELKLTVISFPEPIDSSNVTPDDWENLAYIIEENYTQYDGFVILHGTDTMAYTASALSFVLQGLSKPVIFTGAQIPIGSIRSDARENFITALEIASSQNDRKPRISEVCIYFNFVLLRANRSQKVNSSTFSAFHSENYPILAESGIEITYNETFLAPRVQGTLKIESRFDSNVTILKLYPGISEGVVKSILKTDLLRGVVMETFGSGNVMQHQWFLTAIEEAIESGVIVVNVSQCLGGAVDHGKYETSTYIEKVGVLSGKDLTTEAAVTKLMWLLGSNKSKKEISELMMESLVGEMTK